MLLWCSSLSLSAPPLLADDDVLCPRLTHSLGPAGMPQGSIDPSGGREGMTYGPTPVPGTRGNTECGSAVGGDDKPGGRGGPDRGACLRALHCRHSLNSALDLALSGPGRAGVGGVVDCPVGFDSDGLGGAGEGGELDHWSGVHRVPGFPVRAGAQCALEADESRFGGGERVEVGFALSGRAVPRSCRRRWI